MIVDFVNWTSRRCGAGVFVKARSACEFASGYEDILLTRTVAREASGGKRRADQRL